MDVVIVLAKVPRPGAVKTRMMPVLNALESCELAAAFLTDLLVTLRGLAHCNIRLAIPSGEPAAGVASFISGEVTVTEQGPGDLGVRLSRLSTAAFADGAGVVTLVGSDHPNLPASLLDRCRREARAGRVGWIPTLDGGFAAMSLPRSLPELFAAVPWSTSQVADAVRDNARRAGVDLVAARSWYDVDTAQDLVRLASDLATGSACAATRRVLDDLDPPLRARIACSSEESTDA